MRLPGESIQKIFLFFYGVFAEQFINGAGKNGEFLLGELAYYGNGF